MGGVNLVAWFRPELWREVAPDDAPVDVEGFNEDLIGTDGLVMPATQHDALLWLSGSAYDVIFDTARASITELAGLASVAEETSSWPYRHDRDLTGFIDGAENPTLIDAPEVALISEGEPGASGTILLLQKWSHDAGAWEGDARCAAGADHGADQTRQRRTRGPGTRLPRRIHRPRALRYDLPTQHALWDGRGPRHDVRGLQRRASTALRDAGEHVRSCRWCPRRSPRYTRPLTGSYYFVPSTESVRRRISATREHRSGKGLGTRNTSSG